MDYSDEPDIPSPGVTAQPTQGEDADADHRDGAFAQDPPGSSELGDATVPAEQSTAVETVLEKGCLTSYQATPSLVQAVGGATITFDMDYFSKAQLQIYQVFKDAGMNWDREPSLFRLTIFKGTIDEEKPEPSLGVPKPWYPDSKTEEWPP